MESRARKLFSFRRSVAGWSFSLPLLLTLGWLLADLPGAAQPAQPAHSAVITQIKLPNSHWKDTELPPELTDVFGGSGNHTKILYQGVSPVSQLKFYVTQYDYPTQAGLAKRLADMLDEVHRQCTAQASSGVMDSTGTMGNLPTYEFETDKSTNTFLEVRMILCSERLYLLEISGATSSRVGAAQCLNGFSLGGETPLAAGLLDEIASLRTPRPEPPKADATVPKPGFEFTRWRSAITGGGILVAFIIIMLKMLFKRREEEAVNAMPAATQVLPPPVEDTSTASAWQQHVSSTRVTSSQLDDEPPTYAKVLWFFALLGGLLGLVFGAMVAVTMIIQHDQNVGHPARGQVYTQVVQSLFLAGGIVCLIFLIILTVFRHSFLRWPLAAQIISVVLLGILAMPTVLAAIGLVAGLIMMHYGHGVYLH